MQAEVNDDTWDRAVRLGETLVRDALVEKVLRRQERGDHPAHAVAMALGGLRSSSLLMCVSTQAEGRENLERLAVAYVRGIMRESPHPLNEDGTMFVDWREKGGDHGP